MSLLYSTRSCHFVKPRPQTVAAHKAAYSRRQLGASMKEEWTTTSTYDVEPTGPPKVLGLEAATYGAQRTRRHQETDYSVLVSLW